MDDRVRPLNDLPPRPDGDYVLYWAQMNRRVESNHALLHAVSLANAWDKPVLYYEGLTNSYPYANDRLHTFILEGVPDTARELAPLGIGYAFYLRRTTDDPNNAFYQFAERAAAVVTDDYPTFIAREHNARVPQRVRTAFHAVESSCVVPMNALSKREYAAYTIRPKIHKMLPKYLQAAPPLKVRRRWTAPAPAWHVKVTPENIPFLVASCEIDHSVKPSLSFQGGSAAAQRHLNIFLESRLRRYAKDRNEPTGHATSDLSPYLHFGHISGLQVALAAREG